MENIENKIYKKMVRKKGSRVFIESDFRDIASRGAIRIALMRLVKKEKIRRIARGLYDYPLFSDLLNQQLQPDLHKAAEALARKFNWKIQPSPDTALNLLDLSTQIPAKIIYYSNGPDREYKIDSRDLIFKKTTLKHTNLAHPQSEWIVQALEALTPARFNLQIAHKIKEQFDEKMLKKILLDTRGVKGWIFDCIREICLKEIDG